MTDVSDRAKKIIADLSGVPIDNVTDDATLIGDIGFDSLDVIQLEINLKEEFAIDISDKETDALVTVGDCVALIERKVGG